MECMSVVKLNRACCVLAHAAFFFAWSVLSFLRWVIHFIDYKWYNCINLNLCQLTFFSVCYGTILWLVAFHLLWYTFPSSCFFLCNTYNNCSVAKLLCVHTNKATVFFLHNFLPGKHLIISLRFCHDRCFVFCRMMWNWGYPSSKRWSEVGKRRNHHHLGQGRLDIESSAVTNCFV